MGEHLLGRGGAEAVAGTEEEEVGQRPRVKVLAHRGQARTSVCLVRIERIDRVMEALDDAPFATGSIEQAVVKEPVSGDKTPLNTPKTILAISGENRLGDRYPGELQRDLRCRAFSTSKRVDRRPDRQVIKRAIDLIVRTNSEIGGELGGRLITELREKLSNEGAVRKDRQPA